MRGNICGGIRAHQASPSITVFAGSLTQTDEARFDEFVTGKQGLAARSRSRGRPLDRIPDDAAL